MLGRSLELPPGEQKRILGVIDLVLENRGTNGRPKDESPHVTLIWAIIGELRAFCGLLGSALGQQQIVAMEQIAIDSKVTTPAVLLFELYRVVNSSKTERAMLCRQTVQD